jgi:parvulin-like peptidyl-prolyl isomerase
MKRLTVPRWGWRKLALVTACVAGLLGAGYGVRLALLSPATAQPPGPAAGPLLPPEAPDTGSDYARRVVAYVYETEPVTREELGEYLLARCGPEKLATLVNKRIIDQACRQHNIEVTAAEVEAAFAEELRGLNLDVQSFVKSFLSRYKQNLYEWKEDVIRPRLLLTKLCQHSVRVTLDDLQMAFETQYGEKIECRIILYPKTAEGKKKALADYAQIRDSDDAFERAARFQDNSAFAAVGGKVKPFGRYELDDPAVDKYAFRLKPGELSEVIPTRDGFAVLKCIRHIPADTSRTLEGVREKLTKEVTERKVSAKMKEIVPELKKQAQPKILLTRPNSGSSPVMPEGSGPARPNQVVAWYNSDVPITREQLGEYLIACFGAEKLEYMVNERIIEKECAARGVSVGHDEILAALKADLQKLNVDEKEFVKEFLGGYRINLYAYCEDVIRQRLLLVKLCQDRVHITEDDFRKAFEAYHGERLECRMILWPHDQAKFALKEYPKIRDSEAAFAEKAKQQASSSLAGRGGKIGPFGRHTLGNDALEEEAFKLKPGDVSTIIGTPEGDVVLKCDRRIPPDKDVKLEQERPKLEREIRERKVQIEMGVAFREMHEKAKPNLLLRDAARLTDVTGETRKVLAEAQGLIDQGVLPASRK